ncbi:hypothetical protein AB3R30_05120 [Leptolyngbyaceae cyanobacterium UHCC 1019]
MKSSQLPNGMTYSLIASGTEIILSVWEPAQITESRILPFLFKTNYRLSSEAEAHRMLRNYQISG